MTKVLVNKIILLAFMLAMMGMASAQNVSIPDANFKNALLSHSPVIDTNDDDEIQVSEAEAFTGFLNIFNKSISDATGLEAFTNLTKLNIGNNQLTSLDLSLNTQLTFLYGYNNQLSSINLSQNTALDTLNLFNNQLTSLDVSNNQNLIVLSFPYNNVSSFNYHSGIQSSLKFLGYGSNDMANTFDFTLFPNLQTLDVRGSELTSLDVSEMSSLTILYCNDNTLTNLDISNGNQFQVLSATGNPDLTCIQVDNLSDVPVNIYTDAGVSFDENCSDPTVVFNDSALESAMLGISGIDANMDGKIVRSEAVAVTQSLDLSNLGIENAKELQEFINITGIDLSNNDLVKLNLSANTALTSVDVSNNSLKHFTIKNGNNASIASFDATGNIDLTCISVDDVTYSNTNWTNIPAGTGFDTDCAVNIPDSNFKNALLAHSPVIDTNDDDEIQLDEVESFSGTLMLHSKGITDMTGIEAFANITTLSIESNTTLSSIDISQNTNLTTFYASNCDLSTIDVSNNPNLTSLFIYSNDLTSLDLSNNAGISQVYCSNNNISTFSLPADPTNLRVLDIANNPFTTTFDFSSYTTLTYLNLYGSNLTDLDVSMLPNLVTLYAHNNNLTSLNANNGRQLSILYLQNNPDLECVSVFNVENPATNSLNVDAGVGFEVDCNNPVLKFPDPNFEAALFAITPSIDADADGKIGTAEAAAYTGAIDVSNSAIISARGIEAFASITELNISGNQIKTLDLSANVSLTSVDVSDNALTVFKFDNGANTSVSFFDASGNDDLSCITVDNPTYSQSNWASIPAGTGFSADCIIDIPNTAFKTALTSHSPDIDLNDDGEIQTSEAFAFTDDLNASNNTSITDLTGIEAFVNITYLQAVNNDIQSIDVTQNTQLKELRIFNNSDLSEVNMSTLQGLLVAYISGLSLTEVDVSNNPDLISLYIGGNDIVDVDLSNNPKLDFFSASNNNIKTVDFSNNPEIDQIYLSNNELVSLDLSPITGYSNVNITNNINLLCVKVHNLTYANTRVGYNWNAYLSEEECPPPIPDPKLRQALLNHNPVIDTNEDGILQLGEMIAFTDTLHLSYRVISDPTGLESFINAVGLEVNNNSINSIDVSSMTELKHLAVGPMFSGGISELDLSSNTKLESLIVGGSGLNSIDVSNNLNLKELYCAYMQLTSLDLSANSELLVLDIENNDFESIDLSSNTKLTELNARVNPWMSLDLSQNTSLEELNIQAVSTLSSIDLSANTALTKLTADNGGFTSLDLSENIALEYVSCGNDNLTSLIFGNSPNLTELRVSQTSLESVDLSTLSGLEDLNISQGMLTSLDLTQNVQLLEVNAYDNNLTSIDVTNCPSLQYLYVEENQLSTIDLSGNALLEETYLNYNPLIEVDFSNNPLLYSVDIYETQVKSLDFSQNPLIEYVYAYDNDLYAFNIANGNNENIDGLELNNNPNLVCVTVDDVAYAEANFTDIDEGVVFSTGCGNYENDILTFELTSQSESAIIDYENYTISISVVPGTNYTSLNPIVSVSEGASYTPQGAQDFTTSVTYSVLSEDGRTQEWEVTVTEEEVAPTDIILTSTTVDENSAPGTIVAGLSTLDANFNESFTYFVVAVLENNDWQSFDIDGSNLITTNFTSLDFETKNEFTFELEVRDSENEAYSEMVTITLDDVNEAPTDIFLSNSTIDESNPTGSVVGDLSPDDVDQTDTHTYSLKEGNTDNDSFEISGDQLVTAEVLDFETKTTYNLEIIVTDQGGLTFEQEFAISVNNLPAQITSIVLDKTTIDENEDVGTVVGAFSTFGEDLSGSYTYDLVAGVGSDDNASFSVSTNQLLTNGSFNFETQDSYSIRVMVDDGTLTYEEVFTISVNDISESPTDMALSINTIVENNTIGEVIGTLSSTDEDAGESHTYTLVNGTGDTDNMSFDIVGHELQAAEVFDFETQNSYSIRIETNDGNGGTFSKSFTISITDENESIVVVNPIADQPLDEGFGTLDIDLSTVFEDLDGDALTYNISSSDTDIVTVSNVGSILTITEVGGFGSSTITIAANDGSGITTSDEFVVTVSNVNDAPIVVNPLDDQTAVEEGFGAAQFNYADVFEDADGDELTITVTSSDESVVTAEVIANNQIQVNEVGIGTSTITLTADDGNGGVVSDEFIFTVNEAPNNAPIVVNPLDDQTAVEEGFGAAQFNYADVFEDADGDALTITVTSGDETVVTAEVIANNQIQVNEVGIGTSTITLTADDGNGGTVSDEFIFTVNEAPLGVTGLDVKIYPNPSSDFIYVKSNATLSVRLTDLNGREIQSKSGSQLELNIQSLSPGLYILQVNDGDRSSSHRIIKAN